MLLYFFSPKMLKLFLVAAMLLQVLGGKKTLIPADKYLTFRPIMV